MKTASTHFKSIGTRMIRIESMDNSVLGFDGILYLDARLKEKGFGPDKGA